MHIWDLWVKHFFALDPVTKRSNIVYLGVFLKNASKHVSSIHVCWRLFFEYFEMMLRVHYKINYCSTTVF